MKILYYGESPCIITGTALLSRNLLQFMREFGHTVEVVGVNHFEGVPHDEELYPFVIHRCPDTEAYNLDLARDRIKNAEYDLLFLSTDVGQINGLTQAIHETKQQRSFPVYAYSALDCSYINQQTIAGLSYCDQVVMYSEHSAMTAIKFATGMRLSIRVINPGCEPDVFYPLSEEERKETRKKLGITGSRKLFVNVNRNQWRKDPGRTLLIFHEFHKDHPECILYMHMKMWDVGGNLATMANMIGMSMFEPGLEVMFASQEFSEQVGVSREFLNRIYNAADALISTTTGEGWGLTTTDAMAAICPVIIPRNSSAIEIIGENEERGYLARSGGDVDHLIFPYGTTDNPREIVHAEDMLRAMERVYSHPEEAREKAVLAREWTLQHTWAHAKEQWKALFAEIEASCRDKVAV